MPRRNQLSSQLTLSMKQLTWKIRGLFWPDRAEGNKFALPSTRMGSKSRFYRCAMALYKYKKCWHKLWVWCRYRYIFHSLESAGKAIVIFHWLWLWESLLRGKERKVTSWQMIYCALHLSLRFNTFVHFSSTPSTVVICVFFSLGETRTNGSLVSPLLLFNRRGCEKSLFCLLLPTVGIY